MDIHLILYLVRGLSGSGKSTLAQMLASIPNDNGYYPDVFEADDYFISSGPNVNEYLFDKNKLSSAHAACLSNADNSMSMGLRNVIVSNTFSKNWEMQPYKNLANKFGYSVFVIECQNDFGNIHNVPDDVINNMKNRWEKNKN
jgi:predicted kinase